MIKFDKDEFLQPIIYSTNDEYKTRCPVKKEIVEDIQELQQRIYKLNKYMKEHGYDYAYQDCKFNEIEQYDDIQSILQGEEVKDNG